MIRAKRDLTDALGKKRIAGEKVYYKLISDRNIIVVIQRNW